MGQGNAGGHGIATTSREVTLGQDNAGVHAIATTSREVTAELDDTESDDGTEWDYMKAEAFALQQQWKYYDSTQHERDVTKMHEELDQDRMDAENSQVLLSDSEFEEKLQQEMKLIQCDDEEAEPVPYIAEPVANYKSATDIALQQDSVVLAAAFRKKRLTDGDIFHARFLLQSMLEGQEGVDIIATLRGGLGLLLRNYEEEEGKREDEMWRLCKNQVNVIAVGRLLKQRALTGRKTCCQTFYIIDTNYRTHYRHDMSLCLCKMSVRLPHQCNWAKITSVWFRGGESTVYFVACKECGETISASSISPL